MKPSNDINGIPSFDINGHNNSKKQPPLNLNKHDWVTTVTHQTLGFRVAVYGHSTDQKYAIPPLVEANFTLISSEGSQILLSKLGVPCQSKEQYRLFLWASLGFSDEVRLDEQDLLIEYLAAPICGQMFLKGAHGVLCALKLAHAITLQKVGWPFKKLAQPEQCEEVLTVYGVCPVQYCIFKKIVKRTRAY